MYNNYVLDILLLLEALSDFLRSKLNYILYSYYRTCSLSYTFLSFLLYVSICLSEIKQLFWILL